MKLIKKKRSQKTYSSLLFNIMDRCCCWIFSEFPIILRPLGCSKARSPTSAYALMILALDAGSKLLLIAPEAELNLEDFLLEPPPTPVAFFEYLEDLELGDSLAPLPFDVFMAPPFFCLRFRVWMPSFFIVIGRFTLCNLKYNPPFKSKKKKKVNNSCHS